MTCLVCRIRLTTHHAFCLLSFSQEMQNKQTPCWENKNCFCRKMRIRCVSSPSCFFLNLLCLSPHYSVDYSVVLHHPLCPLCTLEIHLPYSIHYVFLSFLVFSRNSSFSYCVVYPSVPSITPMFSHPS